VASSITVSGTNAITALANADAVPGTVKVVTASGAFTLTSGTALVLPSGANITAATGDRFLAVALTNTNVAVFAYTRADGSAIVNPSVPMGTVLYGDYGTIPPKTVYGSGQALSRASYPGYLAAVTRSQIGTLTAGNNTITSLVQTAGLGAGMPLEGTGIPSGTTITSVTLTTIVMSTAATANGSQAVTAFITGYGSGGDSTTVGVKDCRGRTMAGRDNMGGGTIGRITTAGSGINGAQLNASGGGQNQTIAQLNLPNVNFNVTQGLSGAMTGDNGYGGAGQNGTVAFVTSVSSRFNIVPGSTLMNTLNTNVSVNSGGSGTALTTVPPTVIAECVVVVLP
jgi:hypothetical protein